MLNLILAVINCGCAIHLSCTTRKSWKYLSAAQRVLSVVVVVLNVLCCAMNLFRALS